MLVGLLHDKLCEARRHCFVWRVGLIDQHIQHLDLLALLLQLGDKFQATFRSQDDDSGVDGVSRYSAS